MDNRVRPARDIGSERAPSMFVRAATLAPVVLVAALFVLWAAADGGYRPVTWYPGALFLLALLGTLAFGRRLALAQLSRLALAAVAFLAAFTIWTFLSIGWADVKGDAWDGANRTLLYLLVYALLILLPWSNGAAASLLGLYSLGIAAVGAGTFLSALASDHPETFFIDGRLAEPAGYQNATCGLFLMAFWPAVLLASRSEVPIFLRGLLLPVAGLLLELAVLPQSRGSLFAFPFALLLFVVLVPNRVRVAVFLAPVLLVAFAVRHELLDVFPVAESNAGPALRQARDVLAISFLALAVTGIVFALVDARMHLSEPWMRRITRGAAALAAVGTVGAVVLLVAHFGNPVVRISGAWDELRSRDQGFEASSHFSGGLGGNRYDVWRVAVNEFRRSPIQGVGADNFAVDYVRERQTADEPLYPHSLELMVLSQRGIVGAGFFTGFLGCALAAAFRARSRQDRFARALGAGALVVFAYWFVHGSVDWFWEFPGLGAPAIAALGLAGAVGRRSPPTWVGSSRGFPFRVALTVAGALAATSLTLPWFAARNVEQASRTWRTDPGQAFARLERARRLNPLSDRPDLIAGAIASRLGDYPRMREAFERVLDRNPKNWYAYFELAVVSSLENDKVRALELLGQAGALNPSEPVIALVTRKVRAGERISPRVIDRIFLQRVEERTS